MSPLQWNGLSAKLPDGELRIIPRGGSADLWLYRSGDWGTNNYLGKHADIDVAKVYAQAWMENNE